MVAEPPGAIRAVLFHAQFLTNAALRPIHLRCNKMRDMDLLKVQPEAPDQAEGPACV
jgi:hypothetical protein